MDGTYFTILTNLEGKIEAKCNNCKEIKKGVMSSTGNYLAHYKAKHKDKYPAVEEYLKKKSEHVLVTKVKQPAIIDAFTTQCSAETV